MKNKKEYLLKKRTKLLEIIIKEADFIKGSLTKVVRKDAGRSSTECFHLTYKDEDQKTYTKYIPKKFETLVRENIKKMDKVRKIIDEISKINIEIIKIDN